MIKKLPGVLTVALAAALAAEAPAEDKGTEVKLDGLTSTAPADWVKERPSSSMRFAQFKLPKAKGDSEDATLIIFRGLGGSAKQNIERWKGQFKPPEGKKLDDVAKVTEQKVSGRTLTRLDVTGTFQNSPTPRDPRPTANPGFRMIGIQFDGKETIYHIKMFGPEKTVEKHLKGFDGWIKGYDK